MEYGSQRSLSGRMRDEVLRETRFAALVSFNGLRSSRLARHLKDRGAPTMTATRLVSTRPTYQSIRISMAERYAATRRPARWAAICAEV